MHVITYILTTYILYIDKIQERMTQSLSSDHAVCWAPNDAYEQALGSLNTWGGFNRLGRTLLLYGGHLFHTGPAHRSDHPNVHLEAAPYTRVGLPRLRYCYGLRLRGMRPWSSV
jgi:hypothetical protein